MPHIKRRTAAASRSSRSAIQPKTRSKVKEPLLEPSDIRRIVLDAAVQIAPADVVELMTREDELREEGRQLQAPELALLREQLELALDCLKDHVEGNCPQIPFYTISLLGAAVWYFGDVLDVIPDFLPKIGMLDDAAVMAMAFQLAASGLRRYCTWKGRAVDSVLGQPSS
jgi:uncharacterized membrane protein YkvA (DUF1232 family)